MQLDNHFYFLLPMSFGVQQERTLKLVLLMMMMMMMMIMMMMMMMMMNCFCAIVDQRKTFSLISSRDHCLRSSLLRISDKPRTGLEPKPLHHSLCVSKLLIYIISQLIQYADDTITYNMCKVENKLSTIKGLETNIVTLSKWSSEDGLIFINYMCKVGNKLALLKQLRLTSSHFQNRHLKMVSYLSITNKNILSFSQNV